LYNTFLKRLPMLMVLLSTGFYLAACGGGGGGGGDDSPSNGDSVTTPSLQPSTVTGVLTTQTSAITKLMDLITPTSAIALVPATMFLDNSSSPIFANAQDRFTITNVQNGDHSLYIVMGDGAEMEFPFRMAAGRGLDFGTMTLDGGQVRTFNGFNGYHFGWVDEDGDGTNDNFTDVNGDGICDQGYRFAGYAYHMDMGYLDSDNNKINDHFIDADGDGVNDLTGHSYGNGFGFIDEDDDGFNDRFVDVDGDGISDLTGMPYQHPFGWSDANDDGINDRFTDNNGDGINDITGTHYVGMPGWVDLDGDGLNDFFADAYGDGINDIGNMTPYGHGFGWVDEDGDGINDRFIDENGDGINDLASGPFAGQSSSYGYMASHVDENGDGVDDVTRMPYMNGFGWVDENGDGINDVFADKEGDGVNDFFGYHYDGGGYHMSQNFPGGTGMQNPTWPMGPRGGGMMNQ
jgi:hypothetical protein